MEISRDVTFDEEAALKRSRKCQHDEVYEEAAPPGNVEATFLPKDETPEDHDMTEPQEPPMMEISRKRKHAWAREIIQETERYGAPEGSTRRSKKPKPFSNYVSLMCDLVYQEPKNYEEVVQKKEWVEEMTKEYQSIMKNDVWDIVPKPEGKSIVSSKWI